VHTDRKEKLRGFGIKVQNVANNHLLGNHHASSSFPFGNIANFDAASIIPQKWRSVNHSSHLFIIFFYKKSRACGQEFLTNREHNGIMKQNDGILQSRRRGGNR
jgi:hypothetical protein